jgi:hypothetical protein
MKTFYDMLQILEKKVNTGVPWYAHPDTPAIRDRRVKFTKQPQDNTAGTSDQSFSNLVYSSIKNKHAHLIGKRFRIKNDTHLINMFPADSTGVVVNVGGNNITYKMDHEDKKRTSFIRTFPNYVDFLED